MDHIIVTVTNMQKTFLYDLDVPANLTVDKLKDDIVEALNGADPSLFLRTAATELFCNRLGRQLAAEETLETAGVWNGDFITLLEV